MQTGPQESTQACKQEGWQRGRHASKEACQSAGITISKRAGKQPRTKVAAEASWPCTSASHIKQMPICTTDSPHHSCYSPPPSPPPVQRQVIVHCFACILLEVAHNQHGVNHEEVPSQLCRGKGCRGGDGNGGMSPAWCQASTFLLCRVSRATWTLKRSTACERNVAK